MTGVQTCALPIFDAAEDWRVTADLDGWQENYPSFVKENGGRPDIVLISEATKTLILVELTVPFESNIGERHEFKMAKYEDLLKQLHRKGYVTHMFAVEVGARGLVGASVYSLLKRVGLSGGKRTRSLKHIAEAAERESYWIWLKRDNREWKPSSRE